MNRTATTQELAGGAGEAYTDEDALALEVDVLDGELVGERHDDGLVCD